MLRLDPNEELKIDEQDSIIHISTSTLSKTITERLTNAYVVFLSENDRNRRVLSTLFNDQDNEFVSLNLTNLDIVTVNRNLGSDNELSNKKYIDDTIVECTLIKFNQTPQN